MHGNCREPLLALVSMWTSRGLPLSCPARDVVAMRDSSIGCLVCNLCVANILVNETRRRLPCRPSPPKGLSVACNAQCNIIHCPAILPSPFPPLMLLPDRGECRYRPMHMHGLAPTYTDACRHPVLQRAPDVCQVQVSRDRLSAL